MQYHLRYVTSDKEIYLSHLNPFAIVFLVILPSPNCWFELGMAILLVMCSFDKMYFSHSLSSQNRVQTEEMR